MQNGGMILLQNLLILITIIPLFLAIFLGLNRERRLQRGGIIMASGFFLSGAVWTQFLSPEKLHFPLAWLEPATGIGSVAIVAGLVYLTGFRRNYPAILLFLIQLAQWGWLWLQTGGLFGGIGFQVDRLSAVVLLSVNLIGAVTLLYSIRFMETHDRRRSMEKSRQPAYFLAAVLILAAMNGLLLSNHLLVWFFCWQLMILAGFVLISHDRTERAVAGGRVFVNFQLAGGVLFLLAVTLLRPITQSLVSSELLLFADATALWVALACLVSAGMAASSLFPFQAGLLRSLAAPLPAVVLLQCATVATAGIYLMIRFSPLFVNTMLGKIIMVLGALSFAAAALLTVLQQDTRRFLALSAISLQGLVVVLICQPNLQSIYLAVLAVLFHGLAKTLLWLISGSHSTSRWTQGFFLLAVLTMIMPPFAIPAAQWTALEFSLQNPPALLLLICGAAFSLLGWARFAGKRWEMIFLPTPPVPLNWLQLLPQITLSLPVILIGLFPVPLANRWLKPILTENYGRFADIAQADAQTLLLTGVSDFNPLWVFALILAVVLPGWFWLKPNSASQEAAKSEVIEPLAEPSSDLLAEPPTEPPTEPPAFSVQSGGPFRDIVRVLQPVLPEPRKIFFYATVGAAGLIVFMLEVVWR